MDINTIKYEKEERFERFKNKWFNGKLAKVIIWAIILIIISGETAVIIHYGNHDHEIEQIVEYDYFDKFCQYLNDTSPMVYSGLSREDMLKHYESWYMNKGYASIIIDENGNLTSAFYLEDTVDMLNYYLLTGETNF